MYWQNQMYQLRKETEKVDATLVATLNKKLGFDVTNGVGIKTYKNGESYYVRIKHFWWRLDSLERR